LVGPDAKLRTAHDVDSLISAEFPDPETHPRLYELVKKLMPHGSCSNRCIVDGRCSKRFPKEYCQETIILQNGYPQYQRRNDGRTHIHNEHEYNNQDVAPYCVFLLLLFLCHINVEITFNSHSIKYLYKYFHKGSDRTTLRTQASDEVRQYLDACSVTGQEALWRLWKRNLHIQKPSVMALPVHEPGQHRITYDANMDAMTVIDITDGLF